MPKVAEAAVLAVGNIIHQEESRDFESKAVDGVRVLVATATGEGFASVKLKTETANELKPTPGQRVAWMLRYGATGGGDRGAASYATFVRKANHGDIEHAASIIGAKG